jgi:Ca2+-binding RTX toxin-like protein
MTHVPPADRPRRRAPLRSLLALGALGALVAIAASVASGSVFRSAYYTCSAANTPVITGVSGTSLSNSATLNATVDPRGVPTVVTYEAAGRLTAEIPGDDNDLVFYGQKPTNISIVYNAPGAANAALSVSVVPNGSIGWTIMLNLATDGAANVTTTANGVIAAIAATPAAAALVTVGNAPGNDGTGLMGDMNSRALGSSGVSGSIAAVPAGAAQALSVTVTELTPDTPYAFFIVATNECSPTSAFASAYAPVSVLTRANAGITVRGVWDSEPSEATPKISGTVVVAADPAGSGTGPSDSTVTCAGTLEFDGVTGVEQDMNFCDAPFKSGASVTLTATAGPGSYFDHWEGADCAAWETQPVCYTAVVGSLDDAAVFTSRPQLAVAFAGEGDGTVTSSPAGINCTFTTTICQAAYNPGQSVTLTATASPGGAFLTWGGDATVCGATPTCTLKMTKDFNVSVQFIGKPTLTIFRSGSGSGTVSSSTNEINCSDSSALCASKYGVGAKVVLTATPDDDSTFAGWGTDLASCYGTAPTCTITAVSSETITAIFSKGHTLSITPAGNGSGVVTSSPSGVSCPPSCASVFPEGSGVTLSVAALNGSAFAGWDDGPCFDRDAAAVCTVSLTDDIDLPVLFQNPSLPSLTKKTRTSYQGCTVVGTSRNDYLVGTAGNDVVCGGGGNDTLVGKGGNDVLMGGNGNDRLVCGDGCRMYGGAGNDMLVAKGGAYSQLFGGVGNDTLLARNNTRNLLDGGAGRNTARFDRKLDVLRKIQRKL